MSFFVIPNSAITHDASAKTLTLGDGYDAITLEQIFYIYDVTNDDEIYDAQTQKYPITLATGVITYTYPGEGKDTDTIIIKCLPLDKDSTGAYINVADEVKTVEDILTDVYDPATHVLNTSVDVVLGDIKFTDGTHTADIDASGNVMVMPGTGAKIIVTDGTHDANVDATNGLDVNVKALPVSFSTGATDATTVRVKLSNEDLTALETITVADGTSVKIYDGVETALVDTSGNLCTVINALGDGTHLVDITASNEMKVLASDGTSVKLYDGTHTADVTASNELKVLSSDGTSVKIYDGTHTADVNDDGTLDVLAKDGTSVKLYDGTETALVDTSGNLMVMPGTGATVEATQSGTWDIGTVTTVTGITNVVHVDDNSSTLSVDGTVAATQSGTWDIGEVTTLPAITGSVTVNDPSTPAQKLAVDGDGKIGVSSLPNVVMGSGTITTVSTVTAVTDITNAVKVSDNDGSLTVDGTVAVSTVSGAVLTRDDFQAQTVAGQGFIMSWNKVDLATAGNTDLVYTTHATKGCHLKSVHVKATAVGDFTLYENLTLDGTPGGTAVTPLNRNRNSAITAQGTALGDPTITSIGTTPLFTLPIAIGDNFFDYGELAAEWLLKDAEDYSFRINNDSGGNGTYTVYVNFYEDSA